MEFFILEKKLWDNNVIDEQSNDYKVYPRANGSKIRNSEDYLGINGRIHLCNFVDKAPVFDYFHLYSTTYQKEYDWVLLDAYYFTGKNIPLIRGYLISQKFKELLNHYVIAEPYRFYPAKLMYQGEKLDYYIFQLAQDEWKEFQVSKSSFLIDGEKQDIEISGNRDLKKLIRSCEKEEAELSMNIFLRNYADIFYFSQFGYVVSERLKEAIKEAELKDFEFLLTGNAIFEFENFPEELK